MKKYYLFFTFVAVVAVGAIALQAVSSGPIKADAALVQEINDAQNAVNDYASTNNALPSGLSATGKAFKNVEYQVTGNNSFELCGTFATSTRNQNDTKPIDVSGGYISAYQHGKGRECFQGKAPSLDAATPMPLKR